MADTTPIPGSKAEDTTPPKSAKPSTDEYKVAETREDGTVVLEMNDDSGGMFLASAPEGISHRKGSTVSVKHDGLDEHGVPKNAVISK